LRIAFRAEGESRPNAVARALVSTNEHLRSKRWVSVVSLLAIALGGGVDARASAIRSSDSSATKGGDGEAISARLASLPLRFEPNQGQFDPRVSFLARTPEYNLFLTRDGATLGFRTENQADGTRSPVLRMRVVGGREVQPSASERQAGRSNYLIGSDPAKWRTGVEGYARVRYPEVLPGVDLVYYGAGAQRLEYDVVLAPGRDPKSVALAFEGAESIAIDASGSALLKLPGGRTVVEPAPLAYQLDAAGQRERVDIRYVRGAGGLGFAVGRFDATRALVIDPTLIYSTFLGGTGSDGAYGVAVDASGAMYLAGTTASTNFPGASFPESDAAGNYHVFVTKLNQTGSAIVYSTYLGGNGGDFANGLAIDSAGEAFVVGATSSTNFPIASTLQSKYGGGSHDGFVTKLSASGSMVYSTYVGGSLDDQAEGVAVDSAGEAFVTGLTVSTNFPTASAFQNANLAASGSSTAFVSKLNAAGSLLVYSTYLGGTAQDNAYGIAIDSAGEAFVVGQTSSSNFPTMAALQTNNAGGGDAFVAKLNATGSGLVYSTYLGGSGADSANDIALDGAGEAFVVGSTASGNFPTASPLQATLGGPQDAFVAKLNSAGSALVYSTYLGGSAADYGNSVAVDAANEAFVTGYTSSVDFPTASPIQANNAGKQDVFVTGYSSAGSALLYSTYLGGSDNDLGNRIAVDASGNAVVVGELGDGSTNFPMISPIQGTEAGSDDAFVAKITASSTAAAAAPALGDKAVSLLASLLLLCGIATVAKGRAAQV
jgi:beta-propeller repeat-containing protein